MVKAQLSGFDIVIQGSHVQNSVILQVLVIHQLLFSGMYFFVVSGWKIEDMILG